MAATPSERTGLEPDTDQICSLPCLGAEVEAGLQAVGPGTAGAVVGAVAALDQLVQRLHQLMSSWVQLRIEPLCNYVRLSRYIFRCSHDLA
jgi:hypothetical protein